MSVEEEQVEGAGDEGLQVLAGHDGVEETVLEEKPLALATSRMVTIECTPRSEVTAAPHDNSANLLDL